MKRDYATPSVVTYGRIEELTFGASGPNLDFIFGPGGLPVIDNNNPDCTSNTGACLPVPS